MVSRDVDYMTVADQIRKVLHEFGVHSSTIQPEFGNDDEELAEVSLAKCSSMSRELIPYLLFARSVPVSFVALPRLAGPTPAALPPVWASL